MASEQDLAFFRTLLEADALSRKCFDCGAEKPQWAAVHHAVLLCLDCAGGHRGLGVHLSFVRSTTMDTWHSWKPEAVKRMRAGGNSRAAEFFAQHGAPQTAMRPGATQGACRKSQRLRYTHRSALMYRAMLDAEVDGRRWDPATWTPPQELAGVIGAADGSQGDAGADAKFSAGDAVTYQPDDAAARARRAVILQVNATEPPSYLVQFSDGTRRGARQEQLRPREVSPGVRVQLRLAVARLAEFANRLLAARKRSNSAMVTLSRSDPEAMLLGTEQDDAPGLDFAVFQEQAVANGSFGRRRRASTASSRSSRSAGQLAAGTPPSAAAAPSPSLQPAAPAARAAAQRGPRRQQRQAPSPAAAPTQPPAAEVPPPAAAAPPAAAPAPAPAADPFADFFASISAPETAQGGFEAFVGGATAAPSSAPPHAAAFGFVAAPPQPPPQQAPEGAFAFAAAQPPPERRVSIDDIFATPVPVAPVPEVHQLPARQPQRRPAPPADPFANLLAIMSEEG